MKGRHRAYLASLLAAVLIGCGGSSSLDRFAGRWRGEIRERRLTTRVELTLEIQGGEFRGTLAILSKTEEDIDKGARLPIAAVELEGERLRFVVPIHPGRIDDDAILFDVALEGDHLVGKAQERRKGSQVIPIDFSRS